MLLPVERMLLGFGFENLLKGLLIVSHPELLDGGRLRRSFTRGHRLLDLAGSAGLQLSPGEEEILETLTEHVVWAGRYPVPLAWQDYDPDLNFPDSERHERDVLWRRLFARLREVAWFDRDGVRIGPPIPWEELFVVRREDRA
jgi:hypothetical protein